MLYIKPCNKLPFANEKITFCTVQVLQYFSLNENHFCVQKINVASTMNEVWHWSIDEFWNNQFRRVGEHCFWYLSSFNKINTNAQQYKPFCKKKILTLSIWTFCYEHCLYLFETNQKTTEFNKNNEKHSIFECIWIGSLWFSVSIMLFFKFFSKQYLKNNLDLFFT